MRSSSKFDWITTVESWHEGLGTVLPVSQLNSARLILFDTGANNSEVDLDDVTIHRVVGQVYWQIEDAAAQPGLLIEAYRAPVPMNYETGTLLEGASVNHAGYQTAGMLPDRMWSRIHRYLNTTVGAQEEEHNINGSYSHPFQSVVDIQVKRRLMQGQALVQEWARPFSQDGVVINFRIWNFLRILVEWKG